MATYYAAQSKTEPNSWNVMKSGALNEFGEPWVEEAQVTREQATRMTERLNNGLPAWGGSGLPEMSLDESLYLGEDDDTDYDA